MMDASTRCCQIVIRCKNTSSFGLFTTNKYLVAVVVDLIVVHIPDRCRVRLLTNSGSYVSLSVFYLCRCAVYQVMYVASYDKSFTCMPDMRVHTCNKLFRKDHVTVWMVRFRAVFSNTYVGSWNVFY